MLKEDNNGFINFPIQGRIFNQIESGKTFIYIVAFDTSDISNSAYDLSNLRMILPGDFVSDDVNAKIESSNVRISLDQLISDKIKDDESSNFYFPKSNLKSDKIMSIPMTTCICVGWCEFSYEFRDGNTWYATFRDLSNEGKKLYYTIKKLHNNKEVRILTFNNI